MVAAGAATGIMLITALAGWIAARNGPGGRILDQLATLSLVFPGICLGVAVMEVYLRVPLPIYGSLWIIAIAYVIRYMPYGMRYVYAGVLQLHRELEEAAGVAGASSLTTLRRIVAPLLTPALVAGWLFIFLIANKELSIAVLLASPGSQVIAVSIFDQWVNGQGGELAAFGLVWTVLMTIIACLFFAQMRRGRTDVLWELTAMLTVRGLTKIYANRYDALAGGVRDIDFALPPGTFFTLLGPSGCGKTTTLRCVAGLERPDAGAITLGERVLYDSERKVAVPMNQRGIGMVFQSYAIWPHMTVFENIAFPLRVAKDRRYPREEIRRLVDQALATVGLAGYGDRPATRLSGGQQQRVALARAIVHRPQLLLLDEPLSNLDASLREEMRAELRRLQQQIGITAIYVTHDQAEALAMSDLVAVMDHGRIVQFGEPRAIYFRPENEFVASFIGAANLLAGVTVAMVSAGDIGVLRMDDGGEVALRVSHRQHGRTSGNRVGTSREHRHRTGERHDHEWCECAARFDQRGKFSRRQCAL